MSVKIDRPGKLQKVALGKMTVCDQAQRELKPYRVKELSKEFDPDMLGEITLSHRDGAYFIVDGQHRVQALKDWLGDGWESQQIECRVYTGLTLKQEAHLFDILNNKLTVKTFDKFKVRLTAGEPNEIAVSKIVENQGLRISTTKDQNSVAAVGTLLKIYKRSGEHVLAKALRIIRDSYPGADFEANLIDGMSHLCERYNGVLDEQVAKAKLSTVRGGVIALKNKAEILHRQTRQAQSQCIAAAAVDIINAKRGGKKLPSWWANQS